MPHIITRRRHEAKKPGEHHRVPVLQGVRPLERSRFSAEVMARNYLRLYWRLYRDSQSARIRPAALELAG